MFTFIKRYLKKRKTIKILSDLSDQELRDIGLTRGQIEDVVERLIKDRYLYKIKLIFNYSI